MAKLQEQVKQIYDGHTNYLKSKLGVLPEWILKLARYRMDKCQPCVLNGACPHCKCISPQLFFAPSKEDALKKWPAVNNEEEFKEFEKTENYQNYIKENETITDSTQGSWNQGSEGQGEQSQDNAISPSGE